MSPQSLPSPTPSVFARHLRVRARDGAARLSVGGAVVALALARIAGVALAVVAPARARRRAGGKSAGACRFGSMALAAYTRRRVRCAADGSPLGLVEAAGHILDRHAVAGLIVSRDRQAARVVSQARLR
jgi:hypothetical protein